MTSALITVADAAVPFDYAALPHDVVCVLGYVGLSGATPHVWSTAEAEAARKAVGAWAPIWCPSQDVFGRDEGHRAAAGMLAALPQYGIVKASPLFLDIERGTYDAHPADVAAGITAWSDDLDAAGYTNSYPYAPEDYNHGWVAKWVTLAPTSLPVEWVGQQYTNRGDGGACDLSIFRRDIFASILTDTGGTDMALDTNDKAWIIKQLAALQGNVEGQIGKLHSGTGWGSDWPKNVVTVHDLCASILVKLDADAGDPLDVAALAKGIAASLSPDLAAAVANELAKRLAS